MSMLSCFALLSKYLRRMVKISGYCTLLSDSFHNPLSSPPSTEIALSKVSNNLKTDKVSDCLGSWLICLQFATVDSSFHLIPSTLSHPVIQQILNLFLIWNVSECACDFFFNFSNATGVLLTHCHWIFCFRLFLKQWWSYTHLSHSPSLYLKEG